MLMSGISSTADLYNNAMPGLQAFLNSSVVGQPLEWTWHSNLPPLPIGYVCGFTKNAQKTCVQVDQTMSGYTLYSTSDCSSHCTALGANQWLALSSAWDVSDGTTLTANTNTYLKKSTANSAVLPPEELISIDKGAKCVMAAGATQVFDGYYLCTPSAM